MRYILLHERAAERFGNTLASYGFTPIPLPPEPRLGRIVAAHADTLLCDLGETVLINEHYAEKLPPMLRDRLHTVSDSPSGDYPSDTAFNALPIGRILFARTASLAPSVRSAALDGGYELVNVRQGYARCSTLALASRLAAITADNGMADAMESRGITVLRIRSGHIALDGCAYGFIGGASFVYDPQNACSLHKKPTVYFFGDLSRHPDGAAIAAFIESRGYEVISQDGELTDYGGAVIVET